MPTIAGVCRGNENICMNPSVTGLLSSRRYRRGIGPLATFSRDKTTLFAGNNSGTGKSSLINALQCSGAGLKTGRISDIHHTGTHTTTFPEMVSPSGGGK